MRYRPPGMCLNDFSLLDCDDGWRVLHLQGPPVHPFDAATLETSYGLARSPDLVNWQTLGPAFGIGPAGCFDDAAVWTMSHVALGGGLAMFYTGVSRHPRSWQSIGMAVSDRSDGTGWCRVGTGPVAEADGRWYRADRDMAWRDPYVVADLAGPWSWIMTVCARTAAGPLGHSGCIGLVTSDDLEHWTVRPPLLTPGITAELECPVIERVGEDLLLFACVSEEQSFHAWRSPDIQGPWEHLGRVGPTGAYAPRVAWTADGPLVLHTQRRRFGGTDSGPLVRGCLSQPKLLSFTEAGRPYLAWWPGLQQFLENSPDNRVSDGTAVFRFHDPSEVTMQLGTSAKALRVALSGRSATLGYADGTRLLSETLPAAPRRSARIVRYQEFVEVYVDDHFCLSHVAYAPAEQEAIGWADGKPADVACAEFRLNNEGDSEPATGLFPGSVNQLGRHRLVMPRQQHDRLHRDTMGR